MIPAKPYPRAYVDACRARIDEEIEAFETLSAGSPPEAILRYEPVCFASLVVVLDAMFVQHDGLSGDGGASTEVRLLAESLLANDGVLTVPDGVGYDPATSALGVVPGEAIVIRRADFDRLAREYFRAIESSSGMG